MEVLGDRRFNVQVTEGEGSELAECGEIVTKDVEGTRVGSSDSSKKVGQRVDVGEHSCVRRRNFIQPPLVVVLPEADVGEKESPTGIQPGFADQRATPQRPPLV